MALKVNSNFEYQLKAYGDVRQSFPTIAEMAAYNENLIPNGFITFCEEDNCNYQWLDMNDVDASLNKWRKFTAATDSIDDTLSESLTKTYSISKIKELMKTTGGFIPVDTLPDLTIETERESIETNKIYLVPNPDGISGNEKKEYVCVHIESIPAVYREPLVSVDSDWDTWKSEIENYVNNGGSLTDDFTTYSSVTNTTTMTITTYTEMIESINAGDTDYTTYTARVTSEIITAETAESWSWELIGSLDGANLVFDDFTPNNAIGKIKSGESLLNKDVLQVLKDMLTVDVPTSISLSGVPSADILNEKGAEGIIDVSLSATITLGTGTIPNNTNVIFKKKGIVISTQAFVDGELTYTYTDTSANLTDNTIYSVEVEYMMNETTSTAINTIEYKFVNPIYYGVSTTSEITDITSLSKLISNNSNQTVSYTASNGYCVFCIPDTLSITSIKDANNFENIDSWSYTTTSVTNWTQTESGTMVASQTCIYKVYRTNTPVTCTNFKYQITIA